MLLEAGQVGRECVPPSRVRDTEMIVGKAVHPGEVETEKMLRKTICVPWMGS